MLGSGKGVSGVVRISRNEGGAGTFPDNNPQSDNVSLSGQSNDDSEGQAENEAPQSGPSHNIPDAGFGCK